MRKKNHYLIYFTSLTIISIFAVCSKLDQYTGAGQEVLENIDPMMINFEKNFYPFTADTQITVAAFSLPGTALSGFGHHSGKLAAGSIDDISVYGYTKFILTRAFAEKFDSADILDSIVFVYDTIVDTVRKSVIADSGVNFRLFGCTDENKHIMPKIDSADTPIGTLRQVSADKPHFTATLIDSVLADSIFNKCINFIKCISDTGNNNTQKQQCDSTFLISIFSSGAGLTWFKSAPAMVIHSSRIKRISGKDSLVARTDSLRGVSGIVSQEADFLIDSLATLPISTWLSQRTAVFTIDLSKLWETMSSTGFEELLSAAVVFERRLLTTGGGDSTPSVFYFLSDRLLSEVKDFDALLDTMNKYYSPVTKLKSPGTDTLVLPIDYHLQHYVKDRRQYFYLYLRITSTDVYGKQEILWGKPRFKAVLTTIN